MALGSDNRAMFEDTVSSYLRQRYDDAERRRVVESDAGWSEDHWRSFAELGLLAVGFSECDGGLGGDASEQALIMEQFGRALVAEPFLTTAVIGGGFLRHGTMPDAKDAIAQIGQGSIRIAFAHGEAVARYNVADIACAARREGDTYVIDGSKAVVTGTAGATHLVVTARTSGTRGTRNGISAFLVDMDSLGISRRDYKTISGTGAADLAFADLRVPAARLLAAEGEAVGLIERVLDEATALVCAEGLGVMERLLGDTLEYTSHRHQFGRPLASFQVLQHRMADMLMLKSQAAAITKRAVSLLGAPEAERARIISAAKVYVGKALRFVGQQAIQLHGGMGMTDELAIAFFFKRALEIERQFGSIGHHLARFERLAYATRGQDE